MSQAAPLASLELQYWPKRQTRLVPLSLPPTPSFTNRFTCSVFGQYRTLNPSQPVPLMCTACSQRVWTDHGRLRRVGRRLTENARGGLVVTKPHAVSNTQPAAADPNAAVP